MGWGSMAVCHPERCAREGAREPKDPGAAGSDHADSGSSTETVSCERLDAVWQGTHPRGSSTPPIACSPATLRMTSLKQYCVQTIKVATICDSVQLAARHRSVHRVIRSGPSWRCQSQVNTFPARDIYSFVFRRFVLAVLLFSSLLFSSLLFSSLLCHVFAINSLADNTLGDGRIRFATFLLHILPSGLPSSLPFLPSSSVDNRRGAAFLSGLRSFVT
jgi:hypothetical protein